MQGAGCRIYALEYRLIALAFTAQGLRVGGRGSCIKPRLRVTCDAEDPFLIGREVIRQGCDWSCFLLAKIGGSLEGVRETGLNVSESCTQADRCMVWHTVTRFFYAVLAPALSSNEIDRG